MSFGPEFTLGDDVRVLDTEEARTVCKDWASSLIGKVGTIYSIRSDPETKATVFFDSLGHFLLPLTILEVVEQEIQWVPKRKNNTPGS